MSWEPAAVLEEHCPNKVREYVNEDRQHLNEGGASNRGNQGANRLPQGPLYRLGGGSWGGGPDRDAGADDASRPSRPSTNSSGGGGGVGRASRFFSPPGKCGGAARRGDTDGSEGSDGSLLARRGGLRGGGRRRVVLDHSDDE